MKWFALAILVVTVVAATVFAILNRPSAEASPDVTITVNSSLDSNARDDWPTLREAMMLATEDLSVIVLEEGECLQVSAARWVDPGVCFHANPPGDDSSDTIVFEPAVFQPGSPATILLQDSLPRLDTSDDTVDGSSAGVIVDGGSVDPSTCFSLDSDDNAVKGLEIYNCTIGIYIDVDEQNSVGGSGPGEGNVISGSSTGIVIQWSHGNIVTGNYIGTDASGAIAVPNSTGINLCMDSQDNIIGGTEPGEANIIAFNTGFGVLIGGGLGGGPTGNTIQGNSIHSNGGDGVLVGGPSFSPPTGNTTRLNSIHSNGGKGIHNMDGGNTELEPPTIQSAGSVFGTACADCIIDVYSDDEDEGRVYEGSTTADGDGNWSFSGTPEGPNITATATDDDGNTSEFSAPLTPPWPAPSPSPTPSATPSPTPSPTPTVTPIPGATRTLQWSPGWHNVTWSGASTPEEAFACADGNYAAAYRLVGGGWERHFPDRPDLSNMGSLAPYDAFLILITEEVTCEMPVADAAGTERTLDWGAGWQNDGWTGPDGTAPQDAFACADGSYAAAYRLVAGGWERYFPDRPDISNMGPLDKYDAFLILVTAPATCTMAIAP